MVSKKYLIISRGVSPLLRVFYIGRTLLVKEKIFRTKLNMNTFVNSSLLLIQNIFVIGDVVFKSELLEKIVLERA